MIIGPLICTPDGLSWIEAAPHLIVTCALPSNAIWAWPLMLTFWPSISNGCVAFNVAWPVISLVQSFLYFSSTLSSI